MKILNLFRVLLVTAITMYAATSETLYFTADDGFHGNELWKYKQGEVATLVDDTNAHSQSIWTSGYNKVGDTIYITINKNDNNGTQLWKFENGTLSSVTTGDSVGTTFNPGNLFTLNNELYFTAKNDKNGEEFWKLGANNTPEIKELNTFTAGSNPSNFVTYNGKVLFTATTKEKGRELYETDGSSISLVADINPGSSSSNPSDFIEYNGKLYFAATDAQYGKELRVYDGTSVSLVQDLEPGITGTNYSSPIIYKNKLYFKASYLDGIELYMYDGTSITLASNIGKKEYSGNPNYFTLFDDKLYFSATSYENGNELFYYDETNTTLVSDIKDSTGSSSPRYLTVVGDKLFFTANSAEGDNELFYTTGGTSVTKVDVYPGVNDNNSQNSSSPSYLTKFKGNLYFKANGVKGTELYRFNTSSMRSELVADIYTGYKTYSSGTISQYSGNPNSFTVYNDKLYYLASPSSGSARLYSYTGSGTPSSVDSKLSYMSGFYLADGKMFFTARTTGTQYHDDSSLYQIDGSTLTNISNINTIGDDSITSLIWNNNKLYIAAETIEYGKEMYIYDGSNTSLISDINLDTENINLSSSIIYKNKLVYTRNDDRYGNELWEFDGTNNVLVADIIPGRSDSSPSSFIIMDDKLYFTATFPSKGNELLVYDGTTVSLAADVATGSANSNISELTVNGSTLYFRANTETTGNELWKYKSGTASLVKDIYPGKNKYNHINSSSPSNLVSVGDRVYFRANTETTGNELYYVNSSGVHLAVDAVSGEGSSYPSNLTSYNNKLYFTASLDGKGGELYVYNDNNSTYSIVSDLSEGPSSSSPSLLTVFNGKLVFNARTLDTGVELYEYDGTKITLVKDIDTTVDGNGNARSSNPNGFKVIGDKLFFMANTLAKGNELYMYDGTTVNSFGDMNPKTATYSFSNFLNYKNKLYFSGNTDNHGNELWNYDFTNKPAVVADVRSGINGSNPYYLTKFLNKIYFSANTDNNGTELVTFNGTNTKLELDLQPGAGSSSPSSLIVYKKNLFFLSYGPSGYGVYKYNGFSTPEKLSTAFSGFSSPTICNDVLYFQAIGTDGTGSELWSYDGIESKLVSDIYENGSSSPSNLKCMKDTLYFTANHPTYGNTELWKLDGNETKIAVDTYPGTTYRGTPQNGSVSNLTVVNDTLYFYAKNDANGTELWSYDGTSSTIYDNSYGKSTDGISPMINFNDELYRVVGTYSTKYDLIEYSSGQAVNTSKYNNSLANFIIPKSQPLVNPSSDVVVNEDNGTFEIVFNGFGDPNNADLNITLEHNSTEILDVNSTWISGVKTYSQYDGEEIRIKLKTKENMHGLSVFYLTLDNGIDKTTEAIFVNVLPIDDAPVFTKENMDLHYSIGDGNLKQSIFVEDVDGDNITYSATSNDTSVVTVSVVGNEITFTPKSQTIGNSTTVDITITANGVTLQRTINYRVVMPNYTPTIDSNFSNISILEDADLLKLDLNVSDKNADDLNVTVASSDESIVKVIPSWNNTLSQSNYNHPLKFNLTTVPNANGIVTITIKVTDTNNSTAISDFDVNVTSVNDRPTLDKVFDRIYYKNFEDKNITINATDIEDSNISYSAKAITNNVVKDLTFSGNILIIRHLTGIFGNTDINVTVSDGELNASKVFNVQILSLDKGKDIREEPSATVVTTDANGTKSSNTIGTDIVIEKREDNNGTVSHKIRVGNKEIKASSDINGSIVKTSGNGIETTFESANHNIIAKVEGTVTGKATHTLSIGGSVTEAISDIIGAITKISKDQNNLVQILTSVDYDVNTTLSVSANENGKATHEVKGVGFDSITTSEILGTKTTISDSGIETSVGTKPVPCIDTYLKAVVETATDGTTKTKFQKYNCSDDTVALNSEIPTIDAQFKENNNVTVYEENGLTKIKIETLINQEIKF